MSYMQEANAIAAELRGHAKPKAKGVRGPAKEPTEKALAVLAYCREFFAENDQLPPIHRINDHFGWKSLNAAQNHMDSLVRHRLLERNAVGKLRFARGGRTA
ncbi:MULTISPECIES: hypothetical protein [unclassified Acidovorax]|uniref:hypothetical protein n=1 Tax=unclassified Acidovorax TaxID=2684926 RepID=UPI000F57583C|nr:hypothetical protein [Acidovorax sp. FJL06]RQO83507.1 hypothetical protein DBV10_04070 [Acidovorax sp. FJL06]